MTSLNSETLSAIAGGYHSTPFDVLGAHPTPDGLAIRTFQPQAREVAVLPPTGDGDPRVMEMIHPDGVFEALFDDPTYVFHYRLRITLHDGGVYEMEDPYRFPPVLSEDDLFLFNEGNHFKLYEKLGAQIVQVDGVGGVSFAVWAPNAERVSVVGNFNLWDGRRTPMRNRGECGIWEIFLPGLCEGEIYKYEIRSRETGALLLKADPHALRYEHPPRTGSIVCDIDRYSWGDDGWMARRRARNILEEPVAVYEVHLGSWKRKEGEWPGYLSYRGP